MSTIREGDVGPAVNNLRRLLTARGYPVKVDGDFGPMTFAAVRAFQAQNLDAHGQPLVIDGAVGPLTLWSLTNPKPDIQPVSAVDFSVMPDAAAGGSAMGRAALGVAIAEMKAGAGEEGAGRPSVPS